MGAHATKLTTDTVTIIESHINQQLSSSWTLEQLQSFCLANNSKTNSPANSSAQVLSSDESTSLLVAALRDKYKFGRTFLPALFKANVNKLDRSALDQCMINAAQQVVQKKYKQKIGSADNSSKPSAESKENAAEMKSLLIDHINNLNDEELSAIHRYIKRSAALQPTNNSKTLLMELLDNLTASSSTAVPSSAAASASQYDHLSENGGIDLGEEDSTVAAERNKKTMKAVHRMSLAAAAQAKEVEPVLSGSAAASPTTDILLSNIQGRVWFHQFQSFLYQANEIGRIIIKERKFADNDKTIKPMEPNSGRYYHKEIYYQFAQNFELDLELNSPQNYGFSVISADCTMKSPHLCTVTAEAQSLICLNTRYFLQNKKRLNDLSGGSAEFQQNNTKIARKSQTNLFESFFAWNFGRIESVGQQSSDYLASIYPDEERLLRFFCAELEVYAKSHKIGQQTVRLRGNSLTLANISSTAQFIFTQDFVQRLKSVFHNNYDTISQGLATRLLYFILYLSHNDSSNQGQNQPSTNGWIDEFNSVIEQHCSGAQFSNHVRNALFSILINDFGGSLLSSVDRVVSVSFTTQFKQLSVLPTLLRCLAYSDYELRKLALQDLNTMLLTNSAAVAQFTQIPHYHQLLFSLLGDLARENKQAEPVKSLYALTIHIILSIWRDFFFTRENCASQLHLTLEKLHFCADYNAESRAVANSLLYSFAMKLSALKTSFHQGDYTGREWLNLLNFSSLCRNFVLRSAYWKSDKIVQIDSNSMRNQPSSAGPSSLASNSALKGPNKSTPASSCSPFLPILPNTPMSTAQGGSYTPGSSLKPTTAQLAARKRKELTERGSEVANLEENQRESLSISTEQAIAAAKLNEPSGINGNVAKFTPVAHFNAKNGRAASPLSPLSSSSTSSISSVASDGSFPVDSERNSAISQIHHPQQGSTCSNSGLSLGQIIQKTLSQHQSFAKPMAKKSSVRESLIGNLKTVLFTASKTAQLNDSEGKLAIPAGKPVLSILSGRSSKNFIALTRKDDEIGEEEEESVYGFHWNHSGVCADDKLIEALISLFYALGLSKFDAAQQPNISKADKDYLIVAERESLFWQDCLLFTSLITRKAIEEYKLFNDKRAGKYVKAFLTAKNSRERQATIKEIQEKWITLQDNTGQIHQEKPVGVFTSIALAETKEKSQSYLDSLYTPDEITNALVAADLMLRHLDIKDRSYRLRRYEQCFIGREAVEWLIEHHLASDIDSAITIGNILLEKGVIEAAIKLSSLFKNDESLYRFILPAVSPSSRTSNSNINTNS
jgi:hypothetical protein